MKLLSIDTNAKTIKGQKQGFMTGILYLAPSDQSGVMNTCPFATKGCREACLYTAGRGAFPKIKQARINKTLWLARDKDGFIAQIVKDIHALIRKAKRENMTPCVRLNGTSDLPVETWGIMEQFPDVQFYDYTKNPKRMIANLAGEMPKNYSLTFSRAETPANQKHAQIVLDRGGNVAAVFANDLPKIHGKTRVINGDESDLRFTDPKGVIVGLKAKGKARKDTSGFVIA
jgi:hypothetical protein